MRAVFFIAGLLLLFQVLCFSQQNIPSNNLLLGYQKFPTTITGHAADATGNQYYVGTFKGELTINGNVITSGNGQEDVFWTKINSSGQLVNYKTYGSEGSEQSFNDGLVIGDSSCMLFALRISQQVSIGSFSISPYISSSEVASVTACLVYADSSGSVKWVKRTNLPNFRLFYADGIFHVIGNTFSNSPAVKVENTTVMDSTGLTSIVHLMFDKTGRLLNTKIISTRKKGQGIGVFFINRFSDKKLLLGISCAADSSFTVDNKSISLPGRFAGYSVLLKTDTSYITPKIKLLNPLGNQLYFNGSSTLPIAAAKDSIYTIISYESQAPFTSFDGFTQSPQRNVLYVLDSSLTAKRQIVLGSTFAGNYTSAPQRRKLFFRNVIVKNEQLFFSGQFTGINESPWNSIPVKDTVLGILPDLKLTADQNGPSRSFIARCDLNGFNGIGKWYGDHHEYETIFLNETFFHDAASNRFAFVHMQDNVWNPWMVDSTLSILSGSMKKNADMPEMTQGIKFFEDGSRIVIGYAKGKTALDSAESFITNGLRSDVFLVRLRANNQVAWYKRFYSTLSGSNVRGLEIKNGRAWFLVDYTSSQNDSNFIKAGASVYDVKGSASLLANVDTSGNLTILNLQDPVLRYFNLTSFDFFKNGDIAALSNTGYIGLPGFPATSGISQYVFRINPGTGALLDKRKIYGPSGVDNIKVDKNDQLYISGGTSSSVPYRLYLHDGTKYIDSISFNASTAGLALLKMDWNHLRWQKRFSIAFLSQAEMLLVNNKPVMFSPSLSNQPLSWDGQPIHNGFSSPTLSIVVLDSNGVMTNKKVIPGFQYSNARVGTNGNLYLCGSINQALKLDTIQVNYAASADGLGAVLDSNLTARRAFRVASFYSEWLLDMDIFQDSLIALAYVAQTNPEIFAGRIMVKPGDFAEDAYVGNFTSKTDVVTAINNPLPLFNELIISPNPITNCNLSLFCSVPQSLLSTCLIYQNNGQFITSKMLYLTPGTKQYSIVLPPTLSKGIYYVVISNKKWTTTRSFIKQ